MRRSTKWWLLGGSAGAAAAWAAAYGLTHTGTFARILSGSPRETPKAEERPAPEMPLEDQVQVPELVP
jgi:hypothetical protein